MKYIKFLSAILVLVAFCFASDISETRIDRPKTTLEQPKPKVVKESEYRWYKTPRYEEYTLHYRSCGGKYKNSGYIVYLDPSGWVLLIPFEDDEVRILFNKMQSAKKVAEIMIGD